MENPLNDASPETTPALDALADSLFEAELRVTADTPPRRASNTYRLQLHRGFRFEDVDSIVDYLQELGISDCYFSPYLAAREGSTHGYDVIDHTRINPEVGDVATHERLLAHLKARGMGRLLDIVPNHMGFSPTNPFVLDVLENGPQARWGTFFDIDWTPVKDTLGGRVLLPILEDLYGKVLEAGLLVLERDGGQFWITYHDQRLPLRPRSYATVLDSREGEFQSRFDDDDEDVLEYLSIRDAARSLPSCRFCKPEEVEQVRREKEVIKRRLRRLCDQSPRLRAFVDENVASFQGKRGEPRGFDRLHELLEDQVYRLAYWRVASEEINYRRFFDVTELAGIRVEDEQVFEHVHRLLFQWVREGGVTGLRVDHPDGLADPLGYFRKLQETLFLIACLDRLDKEGGNHRDSPSDLKTLSARLRERYRGEVSSNPASPLLRRFPIVAEKILSSGEKLPSDWPIDGTVGYEYLNALNGLFVHSESSDAVDSIYREFTNDRDAFIEVLHDSKVYIERALLASELNTLTRLLNRVAESGRDSRDFTLNDLRRVLVEVVACFRVYRTYLRPGDEISARDRDYIDQAVARARRRLPTVDRLVFDFVREALLMTAPGAGDEQEPALRERFAIRFQQTTGPVQAKGLEDTTFYRQVPLVSLNEVGGDPSRFGGSPSAFHALNSHRLAEWPGGLSTTATHDTKRGEDARIRINVISELSEEWKTRLTRWSRWNARKKTTVNEADCPDAQEEYLLYQTLLGSWPFNGADDHVPADFVDRVVGYMVKAVSEAKRNTTWTDPDPTYKETLSGYVREILQASDAAPFLGDFLPFQRRVARVGVVHSLAQTLLKLASPGTADTYQGCELWDFSMVDPDNRRPVDFEARRTMLDRIKHELASGRSRAEVARERFAAPEDGAIKLYLVWTVLNHRRENADLYLRGAYRPLETSGSRKENVVSFLRSAQGQGVLVVVPRLVAGLMGDDALHPPIGNAVWNETEVLLPDSSPSRWRNLLNDQVTAARISEDRRGLPLGDLFSDIPLALLLPEPDER
ncbi:MAG: malto-oligosyltrehalose synthase [Isosphaeraceae bacterium]